MRKGGESVKEGNITKYRIEGKDMEFPVSVSHDDGFWLHHLSDNTNYLARY